MRFCQLSIVLLFTCCFFYSSISAQTSAAVKIVESLNIQIQAVERGVFDINIQFKSAPIDDTASFSGRVYFFKNQATPNRLGHFALFSQEVLVCAYDGNFFYNFNQKEKVIYLTAADQHSPYEITEGNLFMSLSLFPPYLKTTAPAFDLSSFEHYSVDSMHQAGKTTVQLAYEESFVNSFKLSPTDPDTGRYVINYEISLPDHTLRSISEWQFFMQTPQYQRLEFSPIRPLPADSTLNDLIQWVALIDSGYSMEYYDPNAKVPVPDTALQCVGSTFPTFALPDLNGKTVQSKNLNEGLLLIDFWYRACAPCLRAMPSIENLHQRFGKKGLSVLSINPYDKDAEKLKIFMADRQFSYPVLLDREHVLPNQLGIISYPTLLLVDARTKEILHVENGFGQERAAELAVLIEGLLQK
jgi:peroxiredoxin